MWKAFSLIQKNLIWAIPISMLLGLAFGGIFDARPLKNFIIPITFIMVYPMMVTLNIKSVFKGKDLRLQLFTQFINFVIIPILAFYIGKLFLSGQNPKYGLWAVGLFLIGVLPTSGMTISWTGFAKGNKEAATKMVIFGLVIGAIAAPVYTKVFMGATIDVNMLHMFRQVALFVFVPLIAGVITQVMLKRKYGEKAWDERLKLKFPPFSAIGVVMIAFLAMSLKAKNILSNPTDILIIIIPLVLFYAITYLLLSIIGKLMSRRGDAVAMVFGVVMRDLSIALAIAMTAFGKEGMTIALLISLAYVIQIQSAAWYVKLADKIFGEPVSKGEPAEKEIEQELDKAADHMAAGPEIAPMVPDIKKILYATDLSETARYAVRYACSIGNRYNAHVTVLHVVPDIVEEFSSTAGINLVEHVNEKKWKELNKNRIANAKEAMENRIRETSALVMKEIPACPISEGDIRVEVGNPVKNIVSIAQNEDYDLIIMGTHGHGKLDDLMIGNISSGVIRTSSKPVLIVRIPEMKS